MDEREKQLNELTAIQVKISELKYLMKQDEEQLKAVKMNPGEIPARYKKHKDELDKVQITYAKALQDLGIM